MKASAVLSLFCLTGMLFAQTVTVAPTMPQVAVGQTLQFSAQVTGASNTAVTWSAGGVIGGNPKAGTITAAGLYTAPATLPAQNPVMIVAASVAAPAARATTYVYLLSLGPVITSVSPNPLPLGAYTVTITGTGFQPNATVNNSGIQLAATSTTPTVVKATGWQGAAAAATFTVKNPGSAPSNAITVPVGQPARNPSYTLTVVNGTGSGTYSAGAVVNIGANPPSSGQVFKHWTGASVVNPNAAATTLTMPAANTTVTANYGPVGNPAYTLTVVNGSGSGSYTTGTVVNITANTPPPGQMFQGWTGATVANPTAASTTLTMPAANTTVTATFGGSLTVPYPVSSHPRLWITTSDLPRLRSWAVSTNPIYQQGLVALLNEAVSVYTQNFFPNGVQNPNYPDPGDVQGYQGNLTEQYGLIYAFHSLIDPDPAARIQYATYARNVLMVAMNQAVLGHQAGAPFRDPLFAVYNRANGSGEQWPLIVDWIYNATDAHGNPILTAADKLTIRNVFLIWANDCLNASTTGGDHPAPIGVTNSLGLLPGNQPYRMAANNYYLGHARLLTMMALSIDPADDPPVPGVPPSQVGSTLRSYILNANGAWLYQMFAMFGDPATVAAAYGLPGNGAGLGLASGGLPPEGMLYGHSYAYILGQLLALETAGFNNAAYSGPQIQLIGAPVWDRFVPGFLSSLVPTAKTFPSQPWLGPVYQYASYGDLLRLWATPDFMQPFALLALLEAQNGKTAHLNAARWFAINGVEGGANALMTRITQPFSWSTTQSILYYMLLDPAAPAPTDPRPGYATVFYDAPAGRIVAHSDWSPSGAMFDYRASWISINHQLGDGGQFEFYRKGEWLTKEMSNYDNNALGLTTVYHNTLALQNWSANGTPSLQWYENGEWANGSQWMLGLCAGDPTTVMSTGPGYLYAASDLTRLYDRPNIWTPAAGAVDITQATRSILWLNNDYIVVYDRGTSVHSGLFKRFHLSLVTNPVINGATATETLASGQKLFVQTLLPQNPALSARYAAGDLNPIAQLEPTQYILTAQDPGNPADTRFLHVLQGADAGTSMVTALYMQSISGTSMDGVILGSTAVWFPVSVPIGPVAATLPAPSGVHTALITGLVPSASYSVSVAGGTITLIPGGATTADLGGVLQLKF